MDFFFWAPLTRRGLCCPVDARRASWWPVETNRRTRGGGITTVVAIVWTPTVNGLHVNIDVDNDVNTACDGVRYGVWCESAIWPRLYVAVFIIFPACHKMSLPSSGSENWKSCWSLLVQYYCRYLVPQEACSCRGLVLNTLFFPGQNNHFYLSWMSKFVKCILWEGERINLTLSCYYNIIKHVHANTFSQLHNMHINPPLF